MILTMKTEFKEKFLQHQSFEKDDLISVVESSIKCLLDETHTPEYDTGRKDMNEVFEAVTFLMLEACRNRLPQDDFVGTLVGLGAEQWLIEHFTNIYYENMNQLVQKMKNPNDNLPKFVDFDWRLSVEVGSKYLQDQIFPLFDLTIGILEDNIKVTYNLQIDLPSLTKLAGSWESALREMNSHNMRRVCRTFNKAQ